MVPPWKPTTEVGSDWALGELRCACRVCGSHVNAVVSQASLTGRCGTCGSYELDVVSR